MACSQWWAGEGGSGCKLHRTGPMVRQEARPCDPVSASGCSRGRGGGFLVHEGHLLGWEELGAMRCQSSLMHRRQGRVRA